MNNYLKKLSSEKIELLRKTSVKLDSASKSALPREILAKVSGGDNVSPDACPLCCGTMYIRQDPDTGRYFEYCPKCKISISEVE